MRIGIVNDEGRRVRRSVGVYVLDGESVDVGK